VEGQMNSFENTAAYARKISRELNRRPSPIKAADEYKLEEITEEPKSGSSQGKAAAKPKPGPGA